MQGMLDETDPLKTNLKRKVETGHHSMEEQQIGPDSSKITFSACLYTELNFRLQLKLFFRSC